ncbi:MAG: hypothetical protein FD172_3961, partial [Methylocystaceae bacterium]
GAGHDKDFAGLRSRGFQLGYVRGRHVHINHPCGIV